MNDWPSIPGETPIDDRTGLISKSIQSRAQLNIAEAENIRRVVVKYLATRPTRRTATFDLNWSLRLHREMFGSVWTWAGEVRHVELNLGSPAFRVLTDLQTLIDDLNYWRMDASMPLVEQAARLHHRAVLIHPFLNGNGRWSRMLANIHLKQSRSPITLWPDETLGDSSIIRDEYLIAIRAADRGDYTTLIALHARYI